MTKIMKTIKRPLKRFFHKNGCYAKYEFDFGKFSIFIGTRKPFCKIADFAPYGSGHLVRIQSW